MKIISQSSSIDFIRPKMASPTPEDLEVSVVLPCLNEVETLGQCILQARRALIENDLRGEIVVADNGSTDGSSETAQELGARVVVVPLKGYGSALRGGIAAARGEFIIMGDADQSYDFGDIPRFIEQLRAGRDLVMGNRFHGGILPGAMPWLHRYLGNPVLTGIGRLLFHCPVRDFHCGLRGFRRAAYNKLQLRSTGMEFASEMVIQATLHNWQICEIPTALSPDGRSRPPHLHTWRDGWRHLRFMLICSPRWLFVIPGVLLCGLAFLIGVLHANGVLQGQALPMFSSAIAAMVGYQLLLSGLVAKRFLVSAELYPPDLGLKRLTKWFTVERGLILGCGLIVVGLARLSTIILGTPSSDEATLLSMLPSGVLIVMGAQTAFGACLSGILGEFASEGRQSYPEGYRT